MKQDLSAQLPLEFERPLTQLLTPDEIYNQIDEDLLRKLQEDSRIEFKSALIGSKSLGDYFGMWANTASDGGLIAVGYREDKTGHKKKLTLEGCSKLSQNQLNEIEQTSDIFCPDARAKFKRIPVHRESDGCQDFVIVIRIEYNRTKAVRTVAGEVFVRIGDHKKLLKTVEEINHLRAEKGEIRFEAEPSGLDLQSDFDLSSISDFYAAVLAKKGWGSEHSVEDILSLMHLGKRENGTFIPNVACALLFSKSIRSIIPGSRIRFLRFEGESEGVGEKWNAVKDDFVDGNIPQQIEQIERILKSQLRTFSRLGTGGKFFTSPEYPEFAWYEAIVNALVHRSYGNGNKNAPVFVKMFDDRLVVESPGPFPAFVNPDNIYDVHNPRNPYLMDAMYYLKFVKCAHEGTRRIRDKMKDSELPAPEFRQDESSYSTVRVTLRNNIKQRKVWVDSDVAALLGAQIALSLSEDEKRCINFCVEYEKIGASDAQRLTQKTWPASKKLLDGLVEKGIFEHIHRTDLERDPQARFKLKIPSKGVS